MAILTENFLANTGQFTVIGYNGFPVGSFAITGGQGEFTTGAGTLTAVTALENPWTISSASLFTSAVLGSPTWAYPFPGSFCNIGTGIGKDVNNQLFLECGTSSSTTHIALDILFLFAGTQHNLASVAVTTATLPDRIGFGLNGNIATAWLSFGGVWQSTAIGSVDVSSIYDFTAPGALTGWLVGAHQDTQGASGATTLALSQLQYVAPFVAPTTGATVPNIVGLSQSAANAALIAANLVSGTVTTANDPVVPIGDVISQSIAAGTSEVFGTAVAYVVSLGPVIAAVPDVTGQTLLDAISIIVSAQFTVGAVTLATDPTIPLGSIISQSPVGGTNEPIGTAVNLVESEGPTTLVVPNVVNLSESIAAATIESAGLTVGTISFAPDVLTIPGNISTQNPAAGTSAVPGQPVNLVISTGRAPVVVPFIVDTLPNDANTAITNIGLTVGSISFRESFTVPAGEILAQNPQGGTPVGSGTIVSYTISTGPPIAAPLFDVMTTVISQYANSPTLLQLVQSFAGYVDQTQNFANFYAFVWNVDTAQGFGLDIWGAIVNVSRLLQIPSGAVYVGFQDGSSSGPGPGWDVQPFGQMEGAAAGGQGTWYNAATASLSYLLEDEPYRQLILTKALANIVNTTVPAFNKLLQNLFPGRGNPYVITSGAMAMEFIFDFDLTPIELAILQQSGAVPVPPGVSFTISTP
jgi:beta-lactam-binding protein with PASTA domain